MSKPTFHGLFNTKAEEFIKDLTVSFPDIKQFHSFGLGFIFLMKTNPQKPQEIFHTYVYTKYKDHILQRDEDFFLMTDIPIQSDRQDYWLDFIGNIRQIWQTLDANNKEIIWKYFQVLVALNEKCLNNT